MNQHKPSLSILGSSTFVILCVLSPLFISTVQANSNKASIPTFAMTGNTGYNSVNLPNPPWWVDNNKKYSQCDTYQYNNGHTINGQHASGAGVGATPLSDSPTYRNVWACQPSSGSNNLVQVQFYKNGSVENEWQCTEIVKRYLYQAFGAPSIGGTNGYQVVTNYTNPTNNTLFQQFMNNGTANQVPVVGDVLSFNEYTPGDGGHTAIITASTYKGSPNYQLTILDQNNSNDTNGTGPLQVTNWVINTQNGLGSVSGWMHPYTQVNSNPAGNGNALYGITSTNAQNIWAVGSTGGDAQTLVLHGNGASWIQSPGSAFPGELVGVSIDSVGNIWAVGYNNKVSPYAPVFLEKPASSSTWTSIPVPTFGTAYNLLYAVKALSSTNIWIVGAGGDGVGTALQYNGTSFVTQSRPLGSVQLTSISGSSSNLWIAGVGGSNARFYSASWNSSSQQWSPQNTSNLTNSYLGAGGLYVFSSRNVYAVAQQYSPQVAAILQWNGTQWNPVYTSTLSYSDLTGITAISSTNIWMSGYYVDSNNNQVPLLIKGSRSSWSQITTPFNPPQFFMSITSVASNGNVWAVGYNGNAIASTTTLTEFYS